MLTGIIEIVIHHGKRRIVSKSSVGSINGSQASVRSLNNAASIFTVEIRRICIIDRTYFRSQWFGIIEIKFLTSDDQFFTSAVKFDKHMATTDFVTDPNPTSSVTSIVSNVRIN